MHSVTLVNVLMGRITSSGCTRNDRITRDEVECDPVVPRAAKRSDPTHQIDPSDQVTKVMMFYYIPT